MKNINVMITCCSIHVNDIIFCFKNNVDGADIKVYVVNSLEWELPPAEICDGRFVVPRLDDPEYIPFMLDLCKRTHIDIIFPISSIDLDILAENKEKFEAIGTKVSILDDAILKVANNKVELHKRFGELMPKEIIAKTDSDVNAFYNSVGGRVCCKLANLCGGKGFAVVDDELCDDITLFHRFGKKHYVSLEQLKRVVNKGGHEVILQEYHDGLDYTVSLLADHGKIVRIVGYVGYVLEFGSIMFGEIKHNDMAYKIAERLVAELNLDGNIGIDFLLKKDDSVVLLEINPRINASLPFVAEAGCNMIYLRCKLLLGEDVGPAEPIKEGFKMKKYFATRYFE